MDVEVNTDMQKKRMAVDHNRVRNSNRADNREDTESAPPFGDR